MPTLLGKRLPYDHCTWEGSELVSKIGQPAVDNFLDRENSIKSSNKLESELRTRRKHKMLEAQPSYIHGGELRDFQLKGLNWLAYNWSLGKNGILADEVRSDSSLLKHPPLIPSTRWVSEKQFRQFRS